MTTETKQAAIDILSDTLLAGDTLLAVKRSTSNDGLYRIYDIYRTSAYGGMAMKDPSKMTQTICYGLGFRFDDKRGGLGFGGLQDFREVLTQKVKDVVGVDVHVSVV